MSYRLPDGWTFATPEELARDEKYSLAIGPFGSNLKVKDYRDSGVPLIFVRDIRAESFGGDGTKFVEPEKAKELQAHSAKAGDLLMTKMGDPPGDTAIYPATRPAGIITADCIKLTPDLSITSSEFLKYLFRAEPAKSQILDNTRGVAQQKLSLKRFKSIDLPLPPLNEQRRIVAKIEELTARSRNAKQALDAIPPLLERFRQSVLAAAFRGDLTKQWRQQNPNTDWQKINFSELVDSFQNGLSKRRGKSGLETAVIRLADIDSQRVSRSDMRTIKLSEAEREKYSLEKNDILILRVNGSADLVGRFVLIETTDELAYCDHFIRLRVSSLVLPGWVRLLGDSFAFREHIRKATVSSAGQKTVSQKTLNSFQVALPTLEEQAVICARVASIFTFCDRVQDQVDLGCSRSERLDQSILAKAFRGELVPQDPNDEPASALLARTRERKQERPKVC